MDLRECILAMFGSPRLLEGVLGGHFLDIQINFGSFRANFDPKLKLGQWSLDGPQMTLKLPKMTSTSSN